MFVKKLKLFFTFLIAISLFFIFYNIYNNYIFKNNELSSLIKKRITIKTKQLEYLAYKRYNIKRKIPIVISNKLPASLFGMATINKKNKIVIFLNKKRFQESSDYMIDDVLPHEYAHALMFVLKDFSNKKAGHSSKWIKICKNLEGIKCDRFVNTNDILIGKTNFLY